jgi:hypothetical protein
VVYHPFF